MDKAVRDYLKGERQWLPACRLGHAKYHLGRAAPEVQPFWRDVIKVLEKLQEESR